MSALTSERATPRLGSPMGGAPIPSVYVPPLGIADNVKIFAGGLTVVDSSGYGRPGRASTTDVAIGVSRKTYDNTVTGHAAGGILDIEIEVGVFGFINDSGGGAVLAATAPGTAIYVLDDQTVSLTSTSHIKAGKLWQLGLDGLVYVLVGPAACWP